MAVFIRERSLRDPSPRDLTGLSRSDVRGAKAAYVRALREQDPALARETLADLVALRFGATCSAKTVADYLWDPTGAKAAARKAAYRGVCEQCGEPTSGGDGPGRARALCQRCKHTRHDSRARRHTPESITATLRSWRAAEGAWPTSTQLSRTAMARRGGEHLARYERYGLAARTVARYFGSVRAAVAVAASEQTGAAEPLVDVEDRDDRAHAVLADGHHRPPRIDRSPTTGPAHEQPNHSFHR
jgi:hypothetical protein